MLENISRLGKVLNKKEKKKVVGGKLSSTIGIEERENKCLNILGMSIYTTTCNCANISENHEICVL